MIWDGPWAAKTSVVQLRSSWVMTCAFEQTEDQLVACGGLDNVCSIYYLEPGVSYIQKPIKELQHHDGYLSCCKFVDPQTMLTSSGDSTCILWDVETASVKEMFSDHAGDVMSVSVCPTNPQLFVSGSCDATAKVWDTRTGRCVQTFTGHESDINAVRFMRNGLCFGTASDDARCKLFDIRAYTEVNDFSDDGKGNYGKQGLICLCSYNSYIICSFFLSLWQGLFVECRAWTLAGAGGLS